MSGVLDTQIVIFSKVAEVLKVPGEKKKEMKERRKTSKVSDTWLCRKEK